jgi:nucleoside-diphosphate-sugar epimerase
MISFSSGSTGTIGRYFSRAVTPIQGRIEDQHFIDEIRGLPEESHFLHLAAVVQAKKIEESPLQARQINVEATLRIAEAFLKKSKGNFLFTSTSHVYARSLEKLSEISAVGPINTYAIQKLESERMLIDLFRACPERLRIIRVFSILDWGMPEFTLGGAIQQMASDDNEREIENTDDIRDFLTPKTVAEALEKIVVTDTDQQILNLCSGSALTVGEAAREMLQRRNMKVAAHRFKPGNSQTPCIRGNNKILRETIPSLELNWKISN